MILLTIYFLLNFQWGDNKFNNVIQPVELDQLPILVIDNSDSWHIQLETYGQNWMSPSGIHMDWPCFDKAKYMSVSYISKKLPINPCEIQQVIPCTLTSADIATNRVGHDHPHWLFFNLALGPGLFHYQIHTAGGVLETHWGDPSLSTRDPGSLSFHNTLLHHKPIVIISMPPYCVSHDLIFVSLYGRLIHCLELVARCSSLDEYASTFDLDTLKSHCHEIIKKYTNPQICANLWEACTRQCQTKPHGDMVFENATLFLHDALLLCEFTDAINSSDSGCVLIMLKLLALRYCGMGWTKYAHKTLTLLHNLTHIWPTPLQYKLSFTSFCFNLISFDENIMLKNWLLNPTRKVNVWVPVDLVQEHFIFWTKVCYINTVNQSLTSYRLFIVHRAAMLHGNGWKILPPILTHFGNLQHNWTWPSDHDREQIIIHQGSKMMFMRSSSHFKHTVSTNRNWEGLLRVPHQWFWIFSSLAPHSLLPLFEPTTLPLNAFVHGWGFNPWLASPFLLILGHG